MKVAVSSNGQNLDAQLDPRFGRCNFFLLIDIDDMDFESIENSYRAATGGVGIQAAQLIASKGVTTVITGNCGPNATRVLTAAGIDIVTDQFGMVKDVIELYKGGKVTPKADTRLSSNYGMRMGSCVGMGMGRGRGMEGGMGGGRGMGSGRGMRGGRGMGGGRSMEGVRGRGGLQF